MGITVDEVSDAALAPKEQICAAEAARQGLAPFRLRLSIGDVALCPVTDLPAIDATCSDDEQDPRWEHFAGLSAQRTRRFAFWDLSRHRVRVRASATSGRPLGR